MTLSERIGIGHSGPQRAGCAVSESGSVLCEMMFWVSQCHACIRERTSVRMETHQSLGHDISTKQPGIPPIGPDLVRLLKEGGSAPNGGTFACVQK